MRARGAYGKPLPVSWFGSAFARGCADLPLIEHFLTPGLRCLPEGSATSRQVARSSLGFDDNHVWDQAPTSWVDPGGHAALLQGVRNGAAAAGRIDVLRAYLTDISDSLVTQAARDSS